MGDEQSRGGRADGAFDGEADQDQTEVHVAVDFAVGALRRLAGSLRGAGLDVDWAADLLSTGARPAVLDEAEAALGDLAERVLGAQRAVRRTKRDLANQAK
jgi:hypothetical protein